MVLLIIGIIDMVYLILFIKKLKRILLTQKIILKDSKLVFILIVLLLSVEWLIRRRLGLL